LVFVSLTILKRCSGITAPLFNFGCKFRYFFWEKQMAVLASFQRIVVKCYEMGSYAAIGKYQNFFTFAFLQVVEILLVIVKVESLPNYQK